MSTVRTTSTHTTPTDMPTWAIPVEDLEAMLATDDDIVDTAAIPRLAFREAVEESAATSGAAVTTAPVTTTPVTDEAPQGSTAPVGHVAAPVGHVAAPVGHVAAPVGHSLRRRNANPESIAAIRRNLIAVACVVVSVVLLGAAVTWLAGWIALAVYAVLVIGAAVAMHRVNAHYAPRHSRYSPRHT